jgi:hypothetical protein
MAEKLETKTLFLDTQVFVSANFQFFKGRLLSITKLAKSGEIKLLITSIVIKEVENRIKESIKKARELIANIRKSKDGQILLNINKPSPNIIFDKSIKNEDLSNIILNDFQKFLDTCHVTVVDIDGLSITDVFNQYFDVKPPFKEGIKKNEFPDAFNIAALSRWSKQNRNSIYVVSADEDIIRSCHEINGLISVEKIEQILNLIEEEDERKKGLEQIFERNLTPIKDKIEEEFLSLGFWLEDEVGDVNYVDVENIDIIERYITDISNNEVISRIACKIRFSANVTYNDPDSTVYDKEDDKYLVFEKIEEDVINEINIDMDVLFRMKPKDIDPSIIKVILKVSDIDVSI